MKKTIRVRGNERIGCRLPPYLIAEIGTNHNGDIQTAKSLIKASADAGFDCAKFQIYEADEIVSSEVRVKDYGLEKIYGDISAEEMFDKYLKTPKKWFPELLNFCHSSGIDCAATIHGYNGLNWANEMFFDLVKIASMDHNNTPFLKSLVNSINAPLLISFGMALLPDIDSAVTLLSPHKLGFGVLHCVSIYPPKAEELRLANISFLQNRIAVPVGFSDHTDDVNTSLAALSLGSRLFEKHITLNKNCNGPDHSFALEPDQMGTYVHGLRSMAISLDSGEFQPPAVNEYAVRSTYLKSIVTKQNIQQGHRLTASDLTLARPGSGIPPSELESVIGHHVRRALPKGTVLAWEDLDC